MKDFKTANKVYIKSKRSVSSMQKKYLYASIILFLYQVIYNLVTKNNDIVLSLIKNLCISMIIFLLIELVLNLIFKVRDLKNIFKVIPLAIFFSILTIDTNIIVLIISIFMILLLRKIKKGMNISAILFGVLLIYLYKIYYLNESIFMELTNLKDIVKYILGSYSLSPLLLGILFFYLFRHKALKYNIIFSYSLVIFSLLIIYYLIFKNIIIPYNLLFYIIMASGDTSVTPDIREGEIIYGIVLGLFTFIFYLSASNISPLIVILICELFLVKVINKISYKIKLKRLI